MTSLTHANANGRFLLLVVTIVFFAITAAAQGAGDKCRPAGVIRLASEAASKIVIDPPLAEPLATRGVAIILYCAENVHLVPVFGSGALAVSPRAGHLHVRVDDASWVWADASGNPIILMGLLPGQHRVLIELEDTNHHALDKASVTFVVPAKPAAQRPEVRRTDLQQHDLTAPGREVVQVRVDFDAGYAFPKHTHFGEEIIYVLEGTLEYTIDGKTVSVKPGDVLFVPAGVVHSVRNIGTGNGAELATYIVEKGKPLITLVK
ncbi:MAG: DUF6130 family protein [Acidobacteriota bacterium]